ncbi:MAG TPA: hypothetical protein VGM78_14465, partial [Ilumatobacteraceae bacterium]
SGTVTLPVVQVPLRYAGSTVVWFETVTDSGGKPVVAHADCNDVAQSVRFTTPTITTKVQSSTVAPGGKFVDVAVVAGVAADVPMSVLLGVYRNVPGTPVSCSAQDLVFNVTFPATGSGEFPSPAYIVPANELDGITLTAVESLLDTSTTPPMTIATHACGLTTETATVDTTPVNVQGGPSLPTTGIDLQSGMLAGSAVLAAGLALATIARRRRSISVAGS